MEATSESTEPLAFSNKGKWYLCIYIYFFIHFICILIFSGIYVCEIHANDICTYFCLHILYTLIFGVRSTYVRFISHTWIHIKYIQKKMCTNIKSLTIMCWALIICFAAHSYYNPSFKAWHVCNDETNLSEH
jgi:hypothetical protein